tara:strand:- start:2376 stop:2702 length:327 start_codon:yes stop_codon:yes gene_type:complete
MIIDFTAILLAVSGLLNLVLIWYIIQLLKRFLHFQAQLDGFMDKIQEYGEHVDVVYNMESFLGDPTLKNLLSHSKEIAEECDGFKEFYLTETDEVKEEVQEEEVIYGE